ncbi:MAG: VOC family protein [Gammaproteobacteria bacterium]|jgi:catechol 2,3-dioxygenase-like lactoylglutathione lyase family enzyme
MRHVALNVTDLEACERFYVELLGMAVEWRPDADNVYLTSGNDNLALHRVEDFNPAAAAQRLDHLGVFIASEKQVDDWYEFLKACGVVIKATPRTHRDGARSFYCADPEGTVIQLIYHPPIAE